MSVQDDVLTISGERRFVHEETEARGALEFRCKFRWNS